jgi:predicted MPP superfamily phosphohydrolase
VRRALWIFPLAGLLLLGLWVLGTDRSWILLSWLSSTLIALMMALSMALVLSLPFSGAALTIERIVRWIGGKRRDPMVVDQTRRTFVTRGAALIPATTMTVAGYGLLRSYVPVRMPVIPLYFAGLPSDLEGFRILQFSDTHLGNYSGLDDLERMMSDAALLRPDLVLVTGDISDDLKLLPGALRLFGGLNPRFGTFASLGNHEYYRGIRQVLKIIDAGPIPLLKDSGATITVGKSELYLAGVDDPVWALPQGSREVTLRNSLNAALDGAPSDAFYIAMSHRPEGFDFATPQGIQLTLSGHYHGAQVGFAGRSLLESMMPGRYLWGHYQHGASQLYTSAGAGHWFPFRLNCPREAPLYILHRA